MYNGQIPFIVQCNAVSDIFIFYFLFFIFYLFIFLFFILFF